jgi:hypothetical protein
MRITNEYKLPTAFVRLSESDFEYTDKEYRVTSLLKGVRETILERRHHHEIEKDVSDMVWLVFGSAVHSIFEQQPETETELKEERLKISIGEYTLSGQFDLYCDEAKKITDYKTASIWKVIKKDYEDWRAQLLIYGYMMREHGFDVKQGEVIALLKDHSKSKARHEADYPDRPVVKVTFDFTEDDFYGIELWLQGRFKSIAEFEKLSDDDLPVCTQKERWNTGNKYAVMQKNRKKAWRLLDTMEEAEEWIADNGKGDYIDKRMGEDRKCDDYCNVNTFCSYYNSREG